MIFKKKQTRLHLTLGEQLRQKLAAGQSQGSQRWPFASWWEHIFSFHAQHLDSSPPPPPKTPHTMKSSLCVWHSPLPATDLRKSIAGTEVTTTKSGTALPFSSLFSCFLPPLLPPSLTFHPHPNRGLLDKKQKRNLRPSPRYSKFSFQDSNATTGLLVV